MKTARIVIPLICCLANSTTLRAGWIEDRDGKTIIHITLWSVPNAKANDLMTRAKRRTIEEFRQEFSSIFAAKYRDRYSADLARYGAHNWDDVSIGIEKMPTLRGFGVEMGFQEIEQRRAADVLYVNFRQSDAYLRHRLLYPLDRPEEGYASSMTEEEVTFRIPPIVRPIVDRESPEGEKALWALPCASMPLALCITYQKRLFDEKRLPHPTERWTWNDFYKACKELTDPAAGRYGFWSMDDEHEGWVWANFLWSAGAELTVRDPTTGEWRWTLDSDESAKSLDFYTRLCTERWTDAAGNEQLGYVARQVWQHRNAGPPAMRISYAGGELYDAEDEAWGVVPLPLGPGGTRGGELNAQMEGLFRDIKEPAVRDAAWEYLRYNHSEPAVKRRVEMYVEEGKGKFVDPALLRRFGYHDLLEQVPKSVDTCRQIAIETGKPEPHRPHAFWFYQMLSRPVHRAIQRAWDGTLPANDAERLRVLRTILKEEEHWANVTMPGTTRPTTQPVAEPAWP